ncbi:MAG: hypothetical protein JWM28_926, partial [Chitinophagaceae bacterium]|nr:hypothetical protein [Chitinophagaceae bacterium]
KINRGTPNQHTQIAAPVMLRIIQWVVLVPLFTRAQSVEPFDSLMADIIYNNETGLNGQIELLHNYKEKNWLSLLPSIGYDLVTGRPLVNFSFNNFISMNQRKRDLKFQAIQLKDRYHNQLINDTITCQVYYKELKELLQNYAGQLSLLDSSFKLLQIKLEENKKSEATSEDVLKVKLELEKLRLSINQSRNVISAKTLQISLLIKRPVHYNIP